MSEIEIIQEQFDRAMCIEDIFGVLTGDLAQQEVSIRSTFARISKAVHPDTHPCEGADNAFRDLTEFRRRALELIHRGEYGRRLPIPGRERITIAGYKQTRLLVAGDVADVHLGQSDSERVLIKAARFPNDNDLLESEARNLAMLHQKLNAKGSAFASCIPQRHDSILLKDGRRRVNILQPFDGFATVERIRSVMPLGVDGRTVVWMWKRLVLMLDWTYKCGFIHGAVLPCHVMYYPDNDGHTDPDPRKHAVRLIDWCYSIPHTSRTRLSSWVPRFKDIYAPEISGGGKLGPTTDLYMAAKTILTIAGPDTPKAILESIASCTAQNPADRPPDALAHFTAFRKIQTATYGPAKWHDFNLTGGPVQLGFKENL